MRVNISEIIRDPSRRRRLMVFTIMATQAREGVETTKAQAEAAYDRVQASRRGGWKSSG